MSEHVELLAQRVVDEAGLVRLAEVLALKLAPGDVIALHGDLGAGKTTFARALIRGLLADPEAEVPSPTFAIEQTYGGRLPVAHYDLYRLASPDELDEIGFEERLGTALVIVEWPAHGGDRVPDDRIDVVLSAGPTASLRRVTLRAGPRAVSRMRRACEILHFLDHLPDWASARVYDLSGDASVRAYAQVIDGARRAVLMDAPRQPNGPPIRNGLPYSRIAHLAEDVRPFVAVQLALRQAGLGAPELLASDLDGGLLLVEDVGRLDFGGLVRRGHDQGELWRAAVDVLIALHERPIAVRVAVPGGPHHVLPRFDRAALEIEVELLLDWYWPHVHGAAASDDVRATYRTLWSPVIDRMLGEPAGIFLRDFHSPNLFWRPECTGVARVGLIDFQDALAEPWGYDLLSLLQDARVDVPDDIETIERERYMRALAARDPAFDRGAFLARYAAFGAQRNTRLIGLWVRLLVRDGKPGYMQHMARTWRYLARNLAHPGLADLRTWFDRHFPQHAARRDDAAGPSG